MSYAYTSILEEELHIVKTKLEMVENALSAKVPHQYILAMLHGEYCATPLNGPFYGDMEEEDADAT